MSRYTNVGNIPLSISVYLASDSYDHNSDTNTISATTLLKPVKQTILASRVDMVANPPELMSQVSRRLGQSIHDGIENAWLNNLSGTLAKLGYPAKAIASIRVNPTTPNNGDYHDVYLENRLSKKFGKWTITGKFDFLNNGEVEDFKTTKVFSYIKQANNDSYIKQASIYRWLDPKLITASTFKINYLFLDWQASKTYDPTYPKTPALTQAFNLASLQETEQFISYQLLLIETLWEAPEEAIPECTPEELWQTLPVFKYYKNPLSTTRSTKNFPTQGEALLRFVVDKSVGIIVEVPGEVKACKYCNAAPVCKQKDRYIASGELKL